jgi:glycerol-3-phosphate acyltransferase PlsY
MIFIYAIGFGLLGYLSGSLPFAIWITRLVKGVDVRDAGSGHATTTNTIRQAGFLPGALVFFLDVSKGLLPTWLAIHFAPAIWIIPLTAGLAVIGHCWPLFAGFRGGMGLATANGSLMAFAPLAILITYGLLIVLTLIIRQSARATVIAGIFFAPVLWLAGMRGTIIWIAIVVGIIITFRFTIDWNRQYRELWLDREKKTTSESTD